jgi:FeS assembly SUF system protein
MNDDKLMQRIISAIKTVYDPEMPVNVYDLGLIYGIDITDQGIVDISMTLTSPACPVAQSLPAQVEEAVTSVEGIDSARVTVVWDPPWSREVMSDEAKFALNLL